MKDKVRDANFFDKTKRAPELGPVDAIVIAKPNLDVKDPNETAEEIEEVKEKVEETAPTQSTSLSTFMTNLEEIWKSHEIKTPVDEFLGFAGLTPPKLYQSAIEYLNSTGHDRAADDLERKLLQEIDTKVG